MRTSILWLIVGSVAVVAPSAAQTTERIRFNDQLLFLSGSNVAWINFARDIGPGQTDLSQFEQMFSQLHESGGNAMRLWLHTTGEATPEWDGNEVVGPGAGAIEDLRAILDLAWQYEVGLQLCLWSFDMLRISNGPTITDRAYALLSDPELTQTYIDHALVPMVDALEGHPAIIAWEIFNEAEGMSVEYGWDFNRHVPMSDIQRFVNQTAGAIHRADTSAQVTNGMWSFHVLWSGQPGKRGMETLLSAAELDRAAAVLSAKYRHPVTTADVQSHLTMISASTDQNFYTNEALIAAGGDEEGTLDFYNVHYYEWAQSTRSPFHHDYAYWGLDKPLVVGEFFMGGGDDGDPDEVYSIPWEDLYTTLFDRGYAGAMGWQWFNYPHGAEGVVNWPRMLANMETMWDLHREEVDVHPGLWMIYFDAEPPGIEVGQSSELSWAVSGASSVTLDGTPVDSAGTLTVSPETTTTYTLIGSTTEGAADTLRTTVAVMHPSEVNRARMQPAVASSEETCCGPTLSAGFAVDGDPTTRWSSEWEEGLADEDPDDEWIYVDLGAAYDVGRIVLEWEAAHASLFDIDVSYDAQSWTTVVSEEPSDGGTNEIVFIEPIPARYVRMHGRERATEWGFSLYEFEVYGLRSDNQPPSAALTAPLDGRVIEPGGALTLTAHAEDPDGSLQKVAFYVNGAFLGEDNAAPFEVAWSEIVSGEYVVHAEVTDDAGISVQTPTRHVYAHPSSEITRYEAEAAEYSGSISSANASEASGGAYLVMRNDGAITFEVDVPESGRYLATFGFNLYYDVPKHQYLVVNGDTVGDVRFDGVPQEWLQRGVRVDLSAGSNTIALEHFWGWMFFDYLGLSAAPLNVSAEHPIAGAFELLQNYPNPFHPRTVISFTLAHAAPVRLVVYDAVGREVARLLDEVRPAGRYEVPFEARGLASGVYFYRLETETFAETRKMLVLQ